MRLNDNFFQLSPELVLDAVEAALDCARTGVRATGRAFALNSLENRVYDIEMSDDTRVVAKFYRPGRWSAEQILEEHYFLRELAAVEVPVVQPVTLTHSPLSQKVIGDTPSEGTLALSKEGVFFSVFPRSSGRILNELDESRLRVLGRFLARIHSVGKRFPAHHRIRLTPANYGRASLAFLRESTFLEGAMGLRYEAEVEALLHEIEPLLDDRLEVHAVHGDCHLGNVLWNESDPHILDFDDMLIGPPVQDVWMIVRGRDAEALAQREELLGAYEEMCDFDRSTLRLIEPLRALRMIHFSAWIARRWEDPSFQRTFPDFATPQYWQEEICALDEVRALIAKSAYGPPAWDDQ